LHAQCYAEAMYPWEVSRTKSPLVSLNNLGILRILPPPVKQPGPGMPTEGVTPQGRSRGRPKPPRQTVTLGIRF
jgi:hypothetical protein